MTRRRIVLGEKEDMTPEERLRMADQVSIGGPTCYLVHIAS